MEKFTKLTGVAAPMPIINVDTDMIIPKDYLKTIKRTGLGTALFAEVRYKEDGSENPDFVLNQPAYRKSEILVAGDNFGCGSSREHAPWALMGWGIRAVISTSFADIFKGNSLKNGLLPIQVDAATHARLVAAVKADPKAILSIDLAQTELTLPGGEKVRFPIDNFAQHCLLNGIDQLGYILSFDDKIASYESAHG